MARHVRVRSEVIRRDSPTWNRLRADLRKLGGAAYVTAGYLGDGGVVKTETGETLTMPQLAAVHEFGLPPLIPERPHVGPAFDRNRARYEALLTRLLQRWMDGVLELKQVLGLIGLEMVADIRRYITEGPGVPPPNAPSTLARKLKLGKWAKGRAARDAKGRFLKKGTKVEVNAAPRTLVDTGRMVGSLTHSVRFGTSKRPKREG